MRKKRCPKCNKEYPETLEFFGKRKKGFQSYCRKCKKLDDRNYSRRYREEFPEWKKKDNKRNAELISKLVKKYYKKYPERKKAQEIFNREIKKGKIKRQSCVICGKPNAYGHHPDYSKPLEVIWLCQKHHKRLHSFLKSKQKQIN